MKADLHVHTTASDGTSSPTDVVRLALSNGVDVLAIADHDSLGGFAEARGSAEGTGLLLIPTVEFSAVCDNHDVHVLAYFVDPDDPDLERELEAMRLARHRRAEAMVASLAAAGFPLDIDSVLALSNGGTVGRAHIARALVRAGAAETVPDAFRSLIGKGMPHYVAKDAQSPENVVSSLRARGAVPVLAHPGVTRADEIIPGLVEAGLLGIEVYHADHSPEQVAHYAALAERLGLLATGGTDYHGPAGPNPDPGSVHVPEKDVRALLAAGGMA